MRPRRGRSVAAGVLLIVLLATVTLATARPPPQPLCEVCEDDVVDVSDVESATATIAVDGDGVGHWTVRFDLRTNATVDLAAMQSVADDALRGHRGEAVPRNLSVSASADDVILTYDVPGMGHRSASGVLLADYFHSQGDSGRWYGVNADRVVVTGPEGTTLLRAPEHYRLNGKALELEGDYADTFARTISPGWYLTFADDSGPLVGIASRFAVGVDIAQLKGSAVPATMAVPTVLLGAFLAFRDRLGDRFGEASTTSGALAIGTVCTGLMIVAGFVVGLDGAAFLLVTGAGLLGPILALSVALLGIQVALLRETFDLAVDARWLVRYGVVVGVLLLGAAPFVAGTLGPIATGYGSTVAVVTVTLFVPLALARRRSERWLLAATILSAPLLVSLGGAPYGNYSAMYVPLLTAVWALLTGVIGLFAYTVGRSERRVDGPTVQ